MKITDALAKLDVENDEHWTTEGAPLVAVVSEIAGREVKRSEITEAAPQFSRSSPKLEPDPDPETDPASAPPPEPPAPPKGTPRSEGEARYLELDEKIAALKEERDEIDNRMQVLAAEQRKLARFAPKGHNYDHKADQKARLDFIASQQEQRAARFAGVKVDPRSPIDQAMARRRERGAARPQHPQKQR